MIIMRTAQFLISLLGRAHVNKLTISLYTQVVHRKTTVPCQGNPNAIFLSGFQLVKLK